MAGWKTSEDYTAVEQLSGVAKGLLLLTATPEQLVAWVMSAVFVFWIHPATML